MTTQTATRTLSLAPLTDREVYRRHDEADRFLAADVRQGRHEPHNPRHNMFLETLAESRTLAAASLQRLGLTQ